MSHVPLFILYGSATGNAESIAKDLATKYRDQLPKPFSNIVCCEANDFKKKCLPFWEKEPPKDIALKYGLVFVTSTTGNGDSPENASRFIRYLKRRTTIESRPLKNVVYGVLGLGDTNYDKFCENGKVADRKLSECGGERVKPLGMADEATGLEEVVDAWVQDIVGLIAQACLPVQDSCHEEKKMEETTSTDHPLSSNTVLQHGNSSSVGVSTVVGGARPNVQSILNRRLGQPVATSTLPSSSSSSIAPKEGVQKSGTSLSVERLPSEIPGVSKEEKNPNNERLLLDVRSPSPLFILYGTVTGNAEHIAKNLAAKYENMLLDKKDECYFPSVVCCELDEYKKKCTSTWEDDTLLKNELGQKHGVIVITSTTGNGDPPENASRFTRFVKRKTTIESMPFRNVAFAVLGLGDTNYDKFCETGKIIDKKLKELGGTKLMDITCADEATGLEQVVDPWVEKIFDVLTKGCRGTVGMLENEASNVEEEKLESLETTHPVSVLKDNIPYDQESVTDCEPKCTMSLSGIHVLKQLLSSDKIPKVDDALLPTFGSSLSSCQLYNEDGPYERKDSRGLSFSDMDRLTISSCASSNLHYTMNDPFESTILGARYLTTTSTEGAKLATQVLQSSLNDQRGTYDERYDEAKKKIHQTFTLTGEDASKNGKRVIEMKLSLPDDFSLDYQPGDSIGMIISNTADAVGFVLSILQKHHGMVPTQMVILDGKKPVTLVDAIHNHIDLCSPIKNKRILLALSQFAKDANDADALKLLASKDPLGQDLFKSYVEGQRLCVVDMLKLFPSCQAITLEGLFSVLPGIPPRYYSISSSPLNQDKDLPLYLTITFSVVDYMTPTLKLNDGTQLQRRVGGLATSLLEVMCAPHLSGESKVIDTTFLVDRLKLFPKPTADFRLPPSLHIPMILIGPGTGVAPFIGFLRHREAQLASMDSTKMAKFVSEGTWRGGYEFETEDLPVTKNDAKGLVMGADYRDDQRIGEIALYFGCRHEDHDWLYKSEMEDLKGKGVISHLGLAFSRDSTSTSRYVQDKLKNDSHFITKMIAEKEACLYICGDGNAMAKDVQKSLVDILAQNLFKSNANAPEMALNYFNDLKAKKRVLLDIWS